MSLAQTLTVLLLEVEPAIDVFQCEEPACQAQQELKFEMLHMRMYICQRLSKSLSRSLLYLFIW